MFSFCWIYPYFFQNNGGQYLNGNILWCKLNFHLGRPCSFVFWRMYSQQTVGLWEYHKTSNRSSFSGWIISTYRIMVYLFYNLYISVDLAHHELFRAKFGKVGVSMLMFEKRNPSGESLCKQEMPQSQIDRPANEVKEHRKITYKIHCKVVLVYTKRGGSKPATPFGVNLHLLS